MESRIKRDGFEFGSFSGETLGTCKTLIVTPKNLDEAVAYIRRQGIEYVFLDGPADRVSPRFDVSVLGPCNSIRRLSVGGCISGIRFLIQQLPLEWLSIDNSLVNEKLDLSCLTNLEYLSIYKMRKNICGLSNLENLKSFRSWNLTTQTGDLSPLQGLKALQSLELNFPHLMSLNGIAGFRGLKRVSIAYCRKALDVADLFNSETIDEIEIEKGAPSIPEAIKASKTYTLTFDNGHYMIFKRAPGF